MVAKMRPDDVVTMLRTICDPPCLMDFGYQHTGKFKLNLETLNPEEMQRRIHSVWATLQRIAWMEDNHVFLNQVRFKKNKKRPNRNVWSFYIQWVFGPVKSIV